MYKPHLACIPPESSDAVVWRFMDLPKLISLLEKQALFFAKVAKLSKFDPFEGHYPRKTSIRAKKAGKQDSMH